MRRLVVKNQRTFNPCSPPQNCITLKHWDKEQFCPIGIHYANVLASVQDLELAGKTLWARCTAGLIYHSSFSTVRAPGLALTKTISTALKSSSNEEMLLRLETTNYDLFGRDYQLRVDTKFPPTHFALNHWEETKVFWLICYNRYSDFPSSLYTSPT